MDHGWRVADHGLGRNSVPSIPKSRILNIQHQHSEKGGQFYYEENGRQMAAMVYVMVNPQKMIIEHTEVDDSMAGKGVGKLLLENLVNYVRTKGIKVIPLCPFANATFKRVKEWQDVLA